MFAKGGNLVPRYYRKLEDEPVTFSSGFEYQPVPERGESISDKKLPVPIQRMKMIAANGRQSTEMLFYVQGCLMASYEDDTVFKGKCEYTYPTFHKLPDNALRGYFGWRTRWRQGKPDEDAPEAFVTMYVYEMINCIKIEPEAAYKELLKVLDVYGEKFRGLAENIRTWALDFLAWYKLPGSLAEPLLHDGTNQAMDVIIEHLTGNKPHETMEIMEAYNTISSYKIMKSALFKKKPQEVAEITVAVMDKVFKRLNDEDYRPGILFPEFTEKFHTMFSRAIFNPLKAGSLKEADHRPYRYYLTPSRGFSVMGVYCLAFGYKENGKNRALGDILHDIDGILREHFPIVSQIMPRFPEYISDRELAGFVKEVLDEREKAEEEKNRIHIDFSKLQDIRDDAAETREALLTDEEKEMMPAPSAPAVPSGPSLWDQMMNDLPDELKVLPPYLAHLARKPVKTEESTPEKTKQHIEEKPAAAGKTKDEDFLLHALLYGGDWKSWAKAKHVKLAMLADRINERFMDEIGDTVIEFDGEEPVLVEDYIDDLKEQIPE